MCEFLERSTHRCTGCSGQLLSFACKQFKIGTIYILKIIFHPIGNIFTCFPISNEIDVAGLMRNCYFERRRALPFMCPSKESISCSFRILQSELIFNSVNNGIVRNCCSFSQIICNIILFDFPLSNQVEVICLPSFSVFLAAVVEPRDLRAPFAFFFDKINCPFTI